jgi:hypothetical protein
MGASGDCSPGQAAALSNGFLILECSSSSAVGSGNTLTVAFTLIADPFLMSGFPHLMTILVVDQSNASDSKTPGVWIVNRSPSVSAASPMNSTSSVGTAQTFTILYSDPDGGSNIAAANFYMSGNGGVINQWLHYFVAPHLFTLMGTNDVCSPGQFKTLSNGSLSLDCRNSTISETETTLTIVFKVTPLAGAINYNFFNAASDQAGAAYAVFGGSWQIP